MKKTQKYLIWDNGGHPFYVQIENGKVSVFMEKEFDPKDEDVDLDDVTYNKTPIFIVKPEKIFIGKNVGGGGKFDGNSILLHLKEKTYIFIGQSIFQFHINGVITHFLSPIGNSGVPYPWAVTEADSIIFLIEKTIIRKAANDDIREGKEEPYQSLLYDESKSIVGDERIWVWDEDDRKFSRAYNHFAPNPGQEYDRLSYNGKHLLRIGEDKKHLRILSREDYITMQEEHAKINNLASLKIDWEIPRRI